MLASRRRLHSVGLLLTASALAVRTDAGEKAGEQVSHFSGSFSQAIPIDVPAFHGLEPRLALSYSSEGRNGLVGVGWSLAGISAVQARKADTYMLDGQDLLACATGMVAASCAAGGQYTTKNESFLKVGAPGDGNFYVWGRDGTKTTFSPTITTAFGGFRWGQTSVVDTRNNAVSYQWNCTAGDCYPSTISYGAYSVSFYLEARPDALESGAWDRIVTTVYRLRSIAVRSGPSLIRAYRLSYAPSAATGRSLLTSVQQYGKDAYVDGSGDISGGSVLPAQTFTYQNDTVAKQFVPTTSGSGTSWCENPYYFLKTGDFNGDGRTDLLCSSYWNIRVALSNGAGFGTPTLWSNDYAVTLVGDFNNDGKTDLAFRDDQTQVVSVALSTGGAFQPLVYWGETGACSGLVPGDYNGDGNTDLLCYRGWDGADSLVGVSNGSSFSFGPWGNLACNGGITVIDMDADWRDDLVCDIGLEVYLYRSTGASFQYPGQAYIGCGANSRAWADVNGDGRTDAVCLNDGRVLRATGSPALVPAFLESAPSGAFCTGTTAFSGADVDGDGASEIVCNNPGAAANDIEVRK